MATNIMFLRIPNANVNCTRNFMNKKLPFPQLLKMENGAKKQREAMNKVANYSNGCMKLGRVWRKIQGLNNWENLMEPLDSLLRDEIIRYGEFVLACYKAFDLDPNSKRYLNCKYGKSSLLQEVGLGDSGYEVTKYIYATPEINIIPPIQNMSPSCCGKWVGYIAVSSDEESFKLGRRDLMISFRGTVTNLEWLVNLMSSLTPARLDPHHPRLDVKVEAGFLSLYTSNEKELKFGLPSCRQQLLSEISRLLNLYKDEEMSITIAGHSMGSALAHLRAYDISELGLNKVVKNDSARVPVTVFSFGGPRVGNSGFKKRFEELGVKVLRIVNAKDPITKLPGVFFNEGFKVFADRYDLPWSCSCYVHVGVELMLDFFKMDNPSCVHGLETYINLLKCHDPAKSNRDLGINVQSKELNIDHKTKILLGFMNILGPNQAPNIMSPSFLYYFLSHILIF
ncbi:OLC1v1018786C1 [Oldenlandia corymbosa var. corymbosa]|uniref:OLC1v1018786C1 n=1 Tax=Oldenlandia corymbosa var. corymbosa TaxID=529605 RepID=A0AAV1ECH5_OLDCO|nr:OLC1v1018786C1 [Oldenlandia corymbosa var. corymbosa]